MVIARKHSINAIQLPRVWLRRQKEKGERNSYIVQVSAAPPAIYLLVASFPTLTPPLQSDPGQSNQVL